MPRGPRALVFDFDGVIADDEPLHLAAFQEALAAEGIALTREAYYARYLGFDDHDAVVEALREAGRPAPQERVRALMAAKADRFLAWCAPARRSSRACRRSCARRRRASRSPSPPARCGTRSS